LIASRPAASRPIRATVSSSWINAWTLRRACAALGVELRSTETRRELPLPRAESTRAAADWIFHTDEASLRSALARADGPAAGASGLPPPQFWPRHFPAELLDDKWAFADWLAQDSAGPPGLPQSALAEFDPTRTRFPLLLKSRHSWVDGRKLPRGWVCRNAAELEARRAALPALDLREDWFFLQTWFGDEAMRLLSVGGFFDSRNASRQLECVTERIADYGAGPSSSALLVTVADEFGLVERTARVLARLDYCGPYEMEFIVSAAGKIHLLELNPRFWMQHGLFLAAGNGLVKRYLGLDSSADRSLPQVPQRLLWADGVWLLRRLLRADFAVVATLWHWTRRRSYRVVVCPSLGFAAWAAVWRLARRCLPAAASSAAPR
jgi:hypothetical protein